MAKDEVNYVVETEVLSPERSRALHQTTYNKAKKVLDELVDWRMRSLGLTIR
jgi:hypothetical protein